MQTRPATGPATPPHRFTADSYAKLERHSGRSGNPPDGQQHSFRRIFRQLLPGPTYPGYLYNTDKTNFENYWHYITAIDVPGQNAQNASPTLLLISQKTYDAEATRRDSINGRCSTVLNTAGILGALVVAAGQLGLMLHDRPVSGATWPVLIFFLISLAYFGYSVSHRLAGAGRYPG